MAMFFAQRVILDKTEFDAVPKALKKQVAEILIDSGPAGDGTGRVRRYEGVKSCSGLCYNGTKE